VVTVSGAIVTQTVTSTPEAAGSSSQQDPITSQRKGLSAGAIAGVVIGVLGAIAALAFGAFLLWRRRRREGDTEGAAAARGFRGPNSPKRNVSVLSRTGLLSRGRPASMNEKDFEDSGYGHTVTGQNSVRHSMLIGASGAGEGISPVSPLGSSHDNDSRRLSKPMVYDQRLNPSALFASHDNGSRVSMQDQQDYSRPLGVMNPDPRASFESRISRA
jgi:cell wall integrity and stress response component